MEEPIMRPCPTCEKIIPSNLKGCWSCGEILDPRLIELEEKLEASHE
ncbi:unnamed protein product [marine sediment metagenome]|uniref:DZANK-type domain-containing protein n=1 Tax=marine sediment metagenome TaxID=412755 RepID=X1GY22_9ZZZZ